MGAIRAGASGCAVIAAVCQGEDVDDGLFIRVNLTYSLHGFEQVFLAAQELEFDFTAAEKLADDAESRVGTL